MSLQYDYDHPGFQLYEELEVSPRASDPVIRAAYGRLMRTHAANRERCVRLQTAFDILSNPTARRAYDAQGAEIIASAKGGGGAIATSSGSQNAQMGLILALSLVAGVLGGLEFMRVLAERGAMPFG
jgi:DnaJ-class molecular chaperone